MMSALEREVLEKFHQLDQDAQRRIRDLIVHEVAMDTRAFDYLAWLRDMEALRQEIRATQGEDAVPFDAISILRDIRDGVDE
jgi:hypothetical protein